MVSEKIFSSFSHYKSMGANDPWGVASLDPRGMVGNTKHCYILNMLTLGLMHGFKICEDSLAL